jgi:hypothetical protein
MTVKEFLNRYDNKETFNEDELKDLFWGDVEASDGMEFEEIEEEADEKRRWSQFVYKYIMIGGRYFCLTADIGLTEYQDNEYDYQPVEVKKTQKTIVVNCWEEL